MVVGLGFGCVAYTDVLVARLGVMFLYWLVGCLCVLLCTWLCCYYVVLRSWLVLIGWKGGIGGLFVVVDVCI